ncbi:hypothetical protein B005_5211 [Nocardiopsis alba ATCC BAA-2165]|uniref:Uncharacterized protein n=1 Tax=Nocardiopsis alba (strain ATCC BAA-2165 / BE74) TaxID=1205910 RepID=J7L4U4_NOCAA|nr:hypothetical protein B005_5211 [Nocardiopsis alba ATCC BAA-2165]
MFFSPVPPTWALVSQDAARSGSVVELCVRLYVSGKALGAMTRRKPGM